MTKNKAATKAMSRATKPTKSTGKPKSQTKAGAKAKRPTTGDWRAATLEHVRRLIHEADPEIVEERKWIKPTNPAGVPVWSHGEIVCTGETYKQVVKLTFMRGASLKDPHKLFNASLEGNARRAIDISEGEELDTEAFQDLIRAAVAENLRASGSKSAPPPKGSAKSKTGEKPKSAATKKPGTKEAKPKKAGKSDKIVYLSGGNPQIAKADGDAPVQAYIAAMPGWKNALGKRLDTLIERNAPNVKKAVKWNSPFYGIEGQGWFLSFHVFTRFVKVTFFAGKSLRPIPPGGTPKSKESRWIDIYEDDHLDEAQMANWINQAAATPGWFP